MNDLIGNRSARAKINLSLQVLRRRPDSYHDLDMIVAFADIADTITFARYKSSGQTADIQLDFSGPFAAGVPTGKDNLIGRAANALLAHATTPCPVHIHVEKAIPHGSGLGGGSSDAALALDTLNQVWDCRLDQAGLIAIGAEIGADVPMCLQGRTLRATGIGEKIETIEPFPEFALVLVWPGKGVETRTVFKALTLDPRSCLPPPDPSKASLSDWIDHFKRAGNDLQSTAITIEPMIGDVLDAIGAEKHCLLAQMTGSGSACLGIFGSHEEAEQAAARLAGQHPDWWVRATRLGLPKTIPGVN